MLSDWLWEGGAQPTPSQRAKPRPQSFTASPYLDLALFSYDDKWVSVMERPKVIARAGCARLRYNFRATSLYTD